MKKQVTVIYSGRVQGVGFRYNAENIARHFDVTGYVRNLPDGRVEMLAEGEEQVLKDFLKAISQSRMERLIRDAQTQWAEARGVYGEFGIAF